MKALRIAVPTDGDQGIMDKVSGIFARAAYFTIIDTVEGEIKEVKAERNIASDFKQGTGPLVAKMLKDNEVDLVITSELGPGARTLLDLSGIRTIQVFSGTKVKDAVIQALE
jgi:predicted Fe-Mo cluster-binding NifX family protein